MTASAKPWKASDPSARPKESLQADRSLVDAQADQRVLVVAVKCARAARSCVSSSTRLLMSPAIKWSVPTGAPRTSVTTLSPSLLASAITAGVAPPLTYVHMYVRTHVYRLPCILPKHTWFSVHMCALFQSESCDITSSKYARDVHVYNIISKTT